jgi:hypothetical protein
MKEVQAYSIVQCCSCQLFNIREKITGVLVKGLACLYLKAASLHQCASKTDRNIIGG